MRAWRSWLRNPLDSKPRPRGYSGVYSDNEQECEAQPTDSLLQWEPGTEKIDHKPPTRRCTKIVNVAQYIIVATIAIVNFTILMLVLAGRIRITTINPTVLPPTMSVDTPQIFHPEPQFTIFSEDRGAAAWKRLTQNFDIGTVYVQNHKEHGLFDSELKSSIPGYENYAVAMYHQLHCLGTIRELFYTLNVTAEMAYGNHIGHCFEYLRQSLICNADLTFEYTSVGWEVEHLCKDPEEVQAVMRAYNKGNDAYPIIR